MARPIKRLKAEPEVVEELRRRSRARTSMVRDRQRAEIILLRLEGVSVAEIAVRLETTAKRVSMWSKRFETRGLAGLEEAAGRGRKPSIPAKKVSVRSSAPGLRIYPWIVSTMILMDTMLDERFNWNL